MLLSKRGGRLEEAGKRKRSKKAAQEGSGGRHREDPTEDDQ